MRERPVVSYEAYEAQCDRDRIASRETSGGGGISPPVEDSLGSLTDEMAGLGTCRTDEADE